MTRNPKQRIKRFVFIQINGRNSMQPVENVNFNMQPTTVMFTSSCKL